MSSSPRSTRRSVASTAPSLRSSRHRPVRSGNAMVRHFLDLAEIDAGDLRLILDESARLKRVRRTPSAPNPLNGKVLAMIFDKPSTRTRVSFDVAMRELGGETILLTGEDMQRRRGETIADTAKVLSRYVDAIMIRTLDHAEVAELAANA